MWRSSPNGSNSPTCWPRGSAAYTEPVSPDELFRLWGLACIPRHGESLNESRVFQAGQLPLARRLEGLAGLADAWVDRRLDSARLRAHILGRWVHLNALPCDSLVEAQLRSACQMLLLNHEVTHVLLHDSAPSRLPDSLVAFGTKPPQLRSREEVARFFEVPMASLEPLIGWSEILREPTDELGFDADDLLEAKRFLHRMMSARDVDRAVGVDGAVAELEYLHLLTPWPGFENEPARYPAGTLVQLFDKIFESIASPEAGASVTPLQDCLPKKAAAGPIVSAIALILNGGLRAYGWEPPFRLVDLRVNADELRHALAASRSAAGEP